MNNNLSLVVYITTKISVRGVRNNTSVVVYTTHAIKQLITRNIITTGRTVGTLSIANPSFFFEINSNREVK